MIFLKTNSALKDDYQKRQEVSSCSFRYRSVHCEDKPSAAKAFAKELDKHILDLLQFPYKYRQSHYYEDEHYRDLTYKGYTVIYKITEDAIQILDIFKWVEK